jgi:O-antigen ligase
MNNIPSHNAPAIIRSLIIYAVGVPLAVVIGYLLTNPVDYSTLGFFGVLALVLVFPLLLRWHHPLLLLSWNATAVMFFLKGSPSFWMVMVALSLGISVLEGILSPEKKLVRVPQLMWPLIIMFAVVVVTAKLTGGFGLRSFGGEVYGGRKYLLTLVGILSYFALTAQKIPAKQTRLALALFFLGGLTAGIGDLFNVVPAAFRFIFWIFPPTSLYYGDVELGTTRLNGVQMVSSSLFFYMMARYGIRGIFNFNKPWRLILFFLFSGVGLLGGYRGVYIVMGGTFVLQFFLEGLHRTKLLPIFAFCGILTMAVAIPLVSKLPFTFQRSLAFLPLPVDPIAKESAKTTVEWRMDLWKAVLPQIPQHLWLGKGYAITMEDYQFMGVDSAFHAVDPGQQGLALSNDYHNGWITVLITFGLWGMLAFLWFAIASIWVLYRNYRHGDPNLAIINCFLLANFAVHFLIFMSFGGGGFHSDLAPFVGSVGLSVVFNGGMCRPAPQPAWVKQPLSPAKFSPRPRPAFQR